MVTIGILWNGPVIVRIQDSEIAFNAVGVSDTDLDVVLCMKSSIFVKPLAFGK